MNKLDRINSNLKSELNIVDTVSTVQKTTEPRLIPLLDIRRISEQKANNAAENLITKIISLSCFPYPHSLPQASVSSSRRLVLRFLSMKLILSHGLSRICQTPK